MTTTDGIREKWDDRHRRAEFPTEPCAVLATCSHLLPTVGIALDVACGLGRNALFMARRGLRVEAWDFSPVAIERLHEAATAEDLTVEARVRDVSTNPPQVNGYDVITVSYFLERSIVASLIGALRPGGLLFYQTFIREAVDAMGPQNQEFRLAENELLRLFAPLRLLVYREEGRVGDTSRGLRNEAMLVAMKAR